MELASLCMVGRAEGWCNGYTMNRHNVAWEDFVMDVYARFLDELGG